MTRMALASHHPYVCGLGSQDCFERRLRELLVVPAYDDVSSGTRNQVGDGCRQLGDDGVESFRKPALVTRRHLYPVADGRGQLRKSRGHRPPADDQDLRSLRSGTRLISGRVDLDLDLDRRAVVPPIAASGGGAGAERLETIAPPGAVEAVAPKGSGGGAIPRDREPEAGSRGRLPDEPGDGDQRRRSPLLQLSADRLGCLHDAGCYPPPGAAGLRLRAKGREKNHLADRGGVGEDHHEPVDSHAEPTRRRHPVFEGIQKVLVNQMGLCIALQA
jgi:hypothetical protein